jgi:hypothetical protein
MKRWQVWDFGPGGYVVEPASGRMQARGQRVVAECCTVEGAWAALRLLTSEEP